MPIDDRVGVGGVGGWSSSPRRCAHWVSGAAAGTPPQANADLLSFADHEGRLAKADLDCDDLTGFTLDYLDAIGRAQQAFLDRNALVVCD